MEFLSIEDNPFGDEGMKHLSRLTNLQQLELGKNNIKTGSIYLRAFVKLRRFFYSSAASYLGHNILTFEGACALKHLSRLTKVQLASVFDKDTVLATRECARSLTNCIELVAFDVRKKLSDVGNCNADDETIYMISRNTNLKELNAGSLAVMQIKTISLARDCSCSLDAADSLFLISTTTGISAGRCNSLSYRCFKNFCVSPSAFR